LLLRPQRHADHRHAEFTKFGFERANGFSRQGRDIILEDGAYVGSGSIVLGPARIGRNAVIYAGAVVIGDVPAHKIYAGVPAKKVGEIPPA